MEMEELAVAEGRLHRPFSAEELEAQAVRMVAGMVMEVPS